MKRILLIIFCTTVLYGQADVRKPVTTFDLPEFSVDALSFSSGDSLTSRVDVYIHVPYDAIQFVKKNDKFSASYEVTLNFLAEDNSSVSEKMWTETVNVPVFDYTENLKAFSLTQRSIDITPGIYTLRSQVRDNESKKVFHVIKKIIVGNYYQRILALSDVMLVNRTDSEGERRTISPNITGNIGENNNSFSIFFEVYSARPADSIRLHYTIVDAKGKEVFSKFQRYRLVGNRSQIITRFDSTQYSSGLYQLNIEARSTSAGQDELPALKQRTFIVRWGNMPISISDLKLAVRQLKYIAKEKEIEAFDDAKTDQEKRRLFDEFWLRRDPNPSTKRNEYMEEYYGRVEYANKNFSHYQQGWNTDMGMVFILFGSPNNVEQHPFDVDSKPYEIWSYYDYNRSIIFVDETGFGDFRLLTPIWDMLQRMKNGQ